MRGRTKPLTELERLFWDTFPQLLLDDPEDPLNKIKDLMRKAAMLQFQAIELQENESRE